MVIRNFRVYKVNTKKKDVQQEQGFKWLLFYFIKIRFKLYNYDKLDYET